MTLQLLLFLQVSRGLVESGQLAKLYSLWLQFHATDDHKPKGEQFINSFSKFHIFDRKFANICEITVETQLKDVRTIIPMSEKAATFPWQACTSTIVFIPITHQQQQQQQHYHHHCPGLHRHQHHQHGTITTTTYSFDFSLNLIWCSVMRIVSFCQGVTDLRQFMQFVNAFNAPLSWLRVIKYLEALSPSTRQVRHVGELELERQLLTADSEFSSEKNRL